MRVKTLLFVAATALSLAPVSYSQSATRPKPTLMLGGITLGSRPGLTVTAPPKTNLERNKLFLAHGFPAAIIVPSKAGILAPEQAAPGDKTMLLDQQKGAKLPDWASPVAVRLDAQHIEWLYRNETNSTGFVIDRLGFLDAIVIAGARDGKTARLESAKGIVDLGDDVRKVISRFGRPDHVEKSALSQGKSQFFEYRYNPKSDLPGTVVFTIRNNRVARIYTVFAP